MTTLLDMTSPAARDANWRDRVPVVAEEGQRLSVLAVEGTLRAPLDLTLRENIAALLGRGQTRILLNLERLREIDAAGVGELVRAYRMAATAGGTLRIEHAIGHVRRILDLVGLLTILGAARR